MNANITSITPTLTLTLQSNFTQQPTTLGGSRSVLRTYALSFLSLTQFPSLRYCSCMQFMVERNFSFLFDVIMRIYGPTWHLAEMKGVKIRHHQL